jgi:hypothetical protein
VNQGFGQAQLGCGSLVLRSNLFYVMSKTPTMYLRLKVNKSFTKIIILLLLPKFSALSMAYEEED